jgi:aspartyl-tRNA(Asn)/glutamyl-tRNA(Gln) amidotransferase subunit A
VKVPLGLSAVALHDLVTRREISCTEVVRAHLDRIGERNPALNAVQTPDPEGALAAAADLDARLARGETPPPLAGVPVLVKDNLCTRGLRTTCGSKILENYIPPYDATCVSRLREAGAVILGKTVLDEFAMGSSTENSAFGPARNPWDPSRVPGGSSGGSASAVAAGMAPLALGSDTGGSVKQPAALCGVAGLRPTYGRVSRFGLVAFASSLDQVGTLARRVEDAFLLLGTISGADPRDATCADLPPLSPERPEGGVRGMKFGLVREHFEDGLDAEVRSAVLGAARLLEGAGAEVREVSLPHAKYALAAYYILATAEASANLARYDGVRYGPRIGGPTAAASCERTRTALFGPEVKRRILMGAFVLSEGYRDAYYLRARRARDLVASDFSRALRDVDLLLGPTTPTPAFPLGEKVEDPVAMYLSDIFTVPSNIAGLPGLSVPCGFSSAGLPMGLQLVGSPFEERTLARAGLFLESALEIIEKGPPA